MPTELNNHVDHDHKNQSNIIALEAAANASSRQSKRRQVGCHEPYQLQASSRSSAEVKGGNSDAPETLYPVALLDRTNYIESTHEAKSRKAHPEGADISSREGKEHETEQRRSPHNSIPLRPLPDSSYSVIVSRGKKALFKKSTTATTPFYGSTSFPLGPFQ